MEWIVKIGTTRTDSSKSIPPLKTQYDLLLHSESSESENEQDPEKEIKSTPISKGNKSDNEKGIY